MRVLLIALAKESLIRIGSIMKKMMRESMLGKKDNGVQEV
jgi:hypothetical protein